MAGNLPEVLRSGPSRGMPPDLSKRLLTGRSLSTCNNADTATMTDLDVLEGRLQHNSDWQIQEIFDNRWKFCKLYLAL